VIGGEWKDVSSYSQSDKVRVPWCYEAVLAGVRLTVVRHRDDPENWSTAADWAMTLSRQPSGPDLEQAKRTAISRVRRACEQILTATAPSVSP
jgi:hypothetical protein